jgi:hypothetical protein
MLNAHFLYPELENYIIDGPVYSLLCFSENSSLVYSNANYQSCSIDSVVWLGVNDTKDDNVKIGYSRHSKEAIVNYSAMPDTPPYFIIYDLTGRLLLQKELTEQTTRIDLSSLAKGVYVYQVVSNNQKLKSGKLSLQ